MSLRAPSSSSTPAGGGHIKLPTRIVESLLLGVLAAGGGFAGGKVSAARIYAPERQVDKLDQRSPTSAKTSSKVSTTS